MVKLLMFDCPTTWGWRVAEKCAVMLLGMIMATSFAMAITALPTGAWAVEGNVIGYAYLDPDEHDENTALVVQVGKRTEAEIAQASCRDLGPWIDGETVPWDDERAAITSATFGHDDGSIHPSGESMSGMFSGCTSLASVDLSGLNTSGVTNMSNMFRGCSSLASLDLSSFDTSAVTSMSYLFYGCTSFASLDLSNFETSNVTNMSYMFRNCKSLSSLDLSGFNTSRVRNLSRMFEGCDFLNRIHLGNQCFVPIPFASTDYWVSETNPAVQYETIDDLMTHLSEAEGSIWFSKKTKDISGECGDCSWEIKEGVLIVSPKSGDRGYLGDWASDVESPDGAPWLEYSNLINAARFEGTVSARTCSSMFEGCEYLASIDLSGLDTSEVEDMHGMFSRCRSLESVDLSSLDMSRVQNMSDMFNSCLSLTAIDLSDLDTSHAGDMSGMFYLCRSLADLDLSPLDTSCVTNMAGLFSGCSSLASLDLSGFDTSRVKNMDHLFSNCSSLASIELTPLNTSSVTNMSYMFYGCSFASIDLTPLKTSQVTDMGSMFANCTSLASIDLSDLDTSCVTSMDGMFAGCASLVTINLSPLKTSGVTDMGSMFANCSSLASIDLSRIDTSQVADMGSMFANCTSLAVIDLSDLDTSCVTSMDSMFAGCTSLATIDLSSLDVSSVAFVNRMFENCPSLTALDLTMFNSNGIRSSTQIIDGCDSLREIRLNRHLDSADAYGLWRSSADGRILVLSEISDGVDTVCERFTKSSDKITYASLSSNGELSFTLDVPIDGAVASWPVSELGYASVEEVPWYALRDSILSVAVKEAGQIRRFDYFFSGCDKLARADLSGFSFERTVSLSGLFDGCRSLSEVVFAKPGNGLIMARADDFSELFRGCTSLKELDLSALSTRKASSMRRMFHGCRSLQSVVLGGRFSFLGVAARRLPGSELPDGAWLPDEAHRQVDEEGMSTAYASDSVPSFAAATYARMSDADLEDPEVHVKVVSLREEDKEGNPQLQVASAMAEDGTEQLTYTVGDDFSFNELAIGESLRAQALKFSSGKVRWNTVVSKVSASSKNSRTTHAIIGSRVKSIAPYAFTGAPNITTMAVKSSKLKKYSRMYSCLAGSNVGRVWVSGMSVSNVRKVVAAFNSWAWM